MTGLTLPQNNEEVARRDVPMEIVAIPRADEFGSLREIALIFKNLMEIT
ncbi:hypothetical protein [Ktedonobacter robiniae]|uniref:Uncharacterized protein n=1 Tax=Ktedonobacter robiniae TaxID=2778365 RepID=A0ABQ3UVC1_9CHLR|nr:hypothetical protein [Ktedonobacter robiniae]GHO56360.1 hypothetical protein KSB_48350 [Ktedonobacter robiniae]